LPWRGTGQNTSVRANANPEDVDERLEDWLAYRCQRRLNPSEARRLLQKILIFTPGKRKGVGEVIRALALQQTGKKQLANSCWKPG